MKIFQSNRLNNKEKPLIFTKEKGVPSSEAPSRGAEGGSFAELLPVLTYLENLKIMPLNNL